MFLLWSLNCQKLSLFLKSFADVSKRSNAVIAIYVYASESFHFVLLENNIGYYAVAYSLDNIRVWSLNFVKFLLRQRFLDILLLNILWAVLRPL